MTTDMSFGTSLEGAHEEGDASTDTTLTPAGGDGEATEVGIETQTKATKAGWVPKDRYKGDPSKWVDAETFVQRGENFLVNIKEELKETRKKLADFEGTKAAFVKFHEEVLAKREAEYKEAITALRVQRSQAQAEGDHEVAIALEDRIDEMKVAQKALRSDPPAKAPPATGPDMANPVLQEWVKDSAPWFETDSKLRDYAVAVGERMIAEGETARGRPFLDKIQEIIHRDFPRRFKNTGTGSLAMAASGVSGDGGMSTKGKTARDLPEVDRQLMKQFIESGLTTEDKFLKSYFNQ